MHKPWSLKPIFLLVILSVMLLASCGKKTVQTDVTAPADTTPAVTEEQPATAGTDTQTAESDAAVIEEETLKAQEALRAEQERRVLEAAARATEEFQTADIYFDYDSSTILDSEIDKLEKKAEWLRNNPSASITIGGHCDSRGTTEYNLALGDRRAARVKAFLMELGISEGQLSTISYGEERPIALGNNEAAWALNRRANFVID